MHGRKQECAERPHRVGYCSLWNYLILGVRYLQQADSTEASGVKEKAMIRLLIGPVLKS